MLYFIHHWYGGSLPPAAFKHKFSVKTNTGTKKHPKWVDGEIEANAIDIPDIHAFVEKYGSIILRRPTEFFPHWGISITDNDSFSQR